MAAISLSILAAYIIGMVVEAVVIMGDKAALAREIVVLVADNVVITVVVMVTILIEVVALTAAKEAWE